MKTNRHSLFFFRLQIAALSIIGAIIFFLLGLVKNDYGYFLIAYSSMPAIYVVVYQLLFRDNDIFTPLNFVWVNLFFSATLQSIFLILLDQGENRYGLYGLSTMETIFFGASVINLGTVCYLIGYSFSIRKNQIRTESKDWSGLKLFVLICFVAALSSFLLYLYITIFEITWSNLSQKRRIETEAGTYSSHTYLRLGAILSQIGFIIVYCHRASLIKKGIKVGAKFNVLLVATFLLGILSPFISSQRSAIIYFLIAIVAVRHFRYKRMTLKQVKLIFVLLITILVTMGALRYVNARNENVQYYVNNAGLEHIVSSVAGSASLIGVSKTGLMVEAVPDVLEYQQGSTYGLWLLMPIPRALWPEKPIVRIGGVVGPIVYYTREKGGTPPGFFAEAYLNFGWFGVGFMSVLLGLFGRFFYDRYGRSAYVNKRSALIYSSMYTILYFAALSSDFSGLMSRALTVLIPIMVFLFVIQKRRDQSSPSHVGVPYRNVT